MKTIRIMAGAGLTVLMIFIGGCAVRVATPPPPALVEVRPAVPFYGAVWIDGYYAYRHNSYSWVPGRYVRPPHRGSAWVPGYWHQDRRGWKWRKGYWR